MAAVQWNDGLGLSLGELSPTRRRQLRIDGGLLVHESTGLARSEGIRAGDLVLAINSQRLDSVEDFRRALSRLPTGRTVALLVMRDLRLAYVPVRITARPASP
jgi:serine protease Do